MHGLLKMQCLRRAVHSYGRSSILDASSPSVNLNGIRALWPSRFYGDAVTIQKRQRKSKEERRELVVSFVEKYMASHEGKFPVFRAVHKEVGGAYTIVREIWQDLAQMQNVDAAQGVDEVETPRQSEVLDAGVDKMGTSRQNRILVDEGADRSIKTAARKMRSAQETSLLTDATTNLIEMVESQQKSSAVGVAEVSRQIEVNDDVANNLHALTDQVGSAVATRILSERVWSEEDTVMSSLTEQVGTAKQEVASVEESSAMSTLRGRVGSSEKMDVMSHEAASIERPVISVVSDQVGSAEEIGMVSDRHMDVSERGELQGKLRVESRRPYVLKENGAETTDSWKSKSLQQVGTLARNTQGKSGLETEKQYVSTSDEETDDDTDIAAPEYTDVEQTIASEEKSREPELKLTYKLFLNAIPSSAKESDLREAFKDCGEIVKAQVLQRQYIGPHNRYGQIHFKTEAGLVAARSKSKVVIKGVEVRIDSGFTKGSQGRNYAFALSRTQVSTGKSQDWKNGDKTNADQHPLFNAQQSVEPNKPTDGFLASTSTKLNHGKLHQEAKVDYDFGVLLHNVPCMIDPSEIKSAMSQYGEMIGMDRKHGPPGTFLYAIQFKTKTAEINVLGSRFVVLKNRRYRVLLAAQPMTTVIRLSNLPSKTSENDIRSLCEAEGQVLSVEPRGSGIVDVHFTVKSLPNMRSILRRLANNTLKGNELCAYTALRFSRDMNHSRVDNELLKLWQRDLVDQLDTFGKQMKLDMRDIRYLMNLKRQAMEQNYHLSKPVLGR